MNLERFSIAAMEEKISSLTPQQRILLFVGTILFLGAAFYFFQYKPQSEATAKLQAALSEQQKRLATLKQAQAKLPALQKELSEAEEEFARLSSLFPDQKEIPALLDSVSQLGAQVGLENILFQPQPERAHEFYAAIPIRLNLLGTYHRLGTFLDSMSKLNRILRVENINMIRQKGGSLLQVDCNIITYRFLEKPPEGQAAPKKK
ncbi:MAG TPA: type 4a pilus biogenesis protein PilO [Syntrophobacteraceae bacterium]|nr:type 4a pilus biogenesis protein PilO [Syntrophobacteraceae bacterium]